MKSRSQSISTYLFLIVLTIAYMTTAQAQEVQVNSANPNSAVQGTLDLDIEIAGSGFNNSAAVDFFVSGSTTNQGGITVKKVKVRGSKKIIATINISDTAETELDFDIEVTLLSSGRRGRGTTLFRVLKKGGGGEGGQALLFETNDVYIPTTEFDICGGATDTTGDSHGQFGVSGNVLWDPNNIHVHFKLQLKDVDPGEYQIFGNNAIACPGMDLTNPLDFPAWEGGVPDVRIIVKQSGKGRTSGVLRLPGRNCGETTTVWVTVPLDFPKILRSTPVTIVLPPNPVGDESCL